jgi:hypothetical protein
LRKRFAFVAGNDVGMAVVICPTDMIPSIQWRQAQTFFVQAVRVKTDLLSRFNKSARRANHPKACLAPLRKIFLMMVGMYW